MGCNTREGQLSGQQIHTYVHVCVCVCVYCVLCTMQPHLHSGKIRILQKSYKQK